MYHVLSLEINLKGIMFRVWGGALQIPALFPSDLFDVVDSRVSSTWSVGLGLDGQTLSLEPQAWRYSGFWENFFDGLEEETQRFETLVNFIINEGEV